MEPDGIVIYMIHGTMNIIFKIVLRKNDTEKWNQTVLPHAQSVIR